MALKDYQASIISTEIDLCRRAAQLKADIDAWSTRYTNGSIASITDADLLTVGTTPVTAFEHLTALEVTNARASLVNIASNLGTNAVSLGAMIP